MLPINSILVDWDETVTKIDTLRSLVEVAGLLHTSKGFNISYNWDQIVNLYINDYEKSINKNNKKFDIKSIVNNKNLSVNERISQIKTAYNSSIQHVENSSVERVENAKIFSNLSLNDFVEKSTEIILPIVYSEWWDLLSYINDYNSKTAHARNLINLYIVSVNWSKEVIESVLTAGLKKINLNNDNFIPFQVFANSFETNSENVTTGNMYSKEGIRTGVDKENILNSISSSNSSLIYIGDSLTDLLPLIEADIGFILVKDLNDTKENPLLKACQSLGFNVSSDPIKCREKINIATWTTILNFFKLVL